jgi:hypothetical protein
VHGPFDQAGRGYPVQADQRWPQDGLARDGYGQGGPRFDRETTAGPIDSSAWSRPADRRRDERTEPAPLQRNRPPAALPAGPSASAAEPESAGTASAGTASAGTASAGTTFDAATSADRAEASAPPGLEAPAAIAPTQTHVSDAVAAVADAVEFQPSAGAASPTGTVKPPPVAALPPPVAALPPPLPLGEPVPSTLAGSPAFDLAGSDGELVRPDDDTAPLPVILPDRMPQEVAQSARMRNPFEPIERSSPSLPRRTPQGDPDAGASSSTVPVPGSAMASSVINAPTSEKMDQIKDLYLTAEAIGEDALGQHFLQVSERQRQLIREYFDHVAGRGVDGQLKD